MLTVRKAEDRGHANHGWLNSHHTFSFAEYHDPNHMGFRSLRVINEDRVAAGQGFGTHRHRDMEIVSYVLDGELEHKDSMGNGEVLCPGEFQRISAGRGITHSEFNPSSEHGTHFYQIWLLPAEKGIEPSYEQKQFDSAVRRNRLQLVASPDGQEGSLRINQDARIYLSNIDQGEVLTVPLQPNRNMWIQVLKGKVSVNNEKLKTGDAVAVAEETEVVLKGIESVEVMIFDLN